MMDYDISVWYAGGGKWTASITFDDDERIFGEAETPALAIVELGFFWEDRARYQNNNIQTLANLMAAQKEG
jgi:hypothetical protein